MKTDIKVTHTPGPWQVADRSQRDTRDGDRYIAIRMPALSCDLIAPPAMTPPEHLANARLIAAAPEMYALLQRVATHFDNTDAPLGLDAAAILARITETGQ